MASSDERRFERFYHAHYDRVAAYLLSRADRDVAQEALARTFEVAWRRFAEIPDEPLPWLLGVARRVLSGQRRAEGRRSALVEHVAASTVASGAGDHADILARRELVAAALATLSEAQREAVLLVAWDGLNQQEAAIVVGCSRVAFAVRLHRARSRLREALSDLLGDARRPTRAPPNPSSASHPAATSNLIEEAP